ncbi:hypothetical protein K4F52_007896 [Lecanicillium sp. MT-2017a]|nr:hypothetical protein K4F52_007896 [Lecanicillium sp. MT-2017a]
MTSPLRALGRWTLDLPTASSSHAVEMHPTGLSSSADVFVHESIPYFWEVRDKATAEGGRGWTLHKTVDGRRFVVAEFRGESAHSVAGVLDSFRK